MLNDTFISLTRLNSTLSHRTNAILNNNILENTRDTLEQHYITLHFRATLHNNILWGSR